MVFGRDPPGGTPAERDADPCALFLEPARGRRDELPGGHDAERRRGGMGLQGVFRPGDDACSRALGSNAGQRRVE